MRFALALCAALLGAASLGGVAAPSGPQSGYGVTTARAVATGALGGTANRVRSGSQQENSQPATAHRTYSDSLPAAVAVARLDVAEPVLLAGRALSGASSRAPPASPGLPDTRAPPTSGRV